MTRRRRGAGRRRPPALAPAEQDSGVTGGQDVYGERMFVVDFTPAGFPIGLGQENEPHWLDED